MNNKKDEKSIIDLIHLVKKKLKDLRIDDSLNDPKLKEAFRRAKPVHWSELTEDEQEAYLIEQAEAKQEFDREQEILKVKQLFQTIMKATCDKSDLRLFTTAKELLESVVKYESNPSSVSNYEWNRSMTVSFTELEALLLAAGKEEKPTETEAETNDKHGAVTYNINGDYVGQDKVGGDKAGRDISKTIVKPDSSSASPGAIEPKPPGLIEKIEWLRLNGRKHWKLILIAVVFLLLCLATKFYFAQLGKGKEIAVKEKGHISREQSDKSNEKQHLSAPQIKFSDGTMATVEFTVQIRLISPDLLIQAHSLYGSAEKASESLMNSLKGVLIASLETKTQDYVRKNRCVVASEIIEQTKDAQQRTAYRIVELSIGEIH